MKDLLIILSLVGMGLRTGGGSSPVHKWKLTDLESYISKADHPLIVNFWATFCAPCNKEIPYFESTVAKFREQGVELILVSLDLPDYYPERIAKFARDHNYHATLAWLNETDADYFCPRIDKGWSGGIPSSLFVNNKKNYHRFYDRQLTELQLGPAVREMISPD